MPARTPNDPPSEPERLKAFAKFFRNYMNVSSLVAAALPIPVTVAGLIPVFHAHKYVLSTYTPMFCFLVLGFVFFSRHALARTMFLRRRPPQHISAARPTWTDTIKSLRDWLWDTFIVFIPLFLIVGTVVCVFQYHAELDRHVTIIRGQLAASMEVAYQEACRSAAPASPVPQRDEVIRSLVQTTPKLQDILDTERLGDKTVSTSTSFILGYTYPEAAPELSRNEVRVPSTALLITYYIGIFACAEGAFVLMAIREYLQDLLGRTDLEVIQERGLIEREAT